MHVGPARRKLFALLHRLWKSDDLLIGLLFGFLAAQIPSCVIWGFHKSTVVYWTLAGVSTIFTSAFVIWLFYQPPEQPPHPGDSDSLVALGAQPGATSP
jgi:hypothetical protein